MNHLELVDMLRKIPTGDNAQPFRYALGQDSIEVIHFNNIARHKFNQGQVASLLSLGMIEFIIKNYSVKNNLNCNIEFANDFKNEDVWLRCHFSPAETVKSNGDEELLNYLSKRQTDRGFYYPKKADVSDIQEALKDSIYFKNNLSSDSYKMITKYETMIFDDLDAFRDIEKWIRYNKKDVDTTRTGMSRQNLKLDLLNSKLFRIFAKGSKLNKWLSFYFKSIIFIRTQTFVRSSAGYGLCVVKDNSDASVIQMGGHILKAWLMLTKKGFAFQPISSPSLISYLARNRSANFQKEYVDGTHKCVETFNTHFGSNGEIIWLFRFGKPVVKMSHPALRLGSYQVMTNVFAKNTAGSESKGKHQEVSA